MPSLLSVIIVSFNTREMTLKCLRVLLGEIANLDAEIFVVDNASSDGSVEAIAREFPQVKLLHNKRNQGFGAANNQAIRLASGEFILLLNSDAFPKNRAISRLIECARKQPRAAVCGPRLLNEDGSLQLSCYRFPSPLKSIWENTLLAAALPNHPIFGDYRSWPHDARREVDFVIGACWLVRRAAIEQVGLFDEEFFLYAEETDWAKRFHHGGWKILFVPEAEVVHLGGGSGGAQPDRVFSEFHRGQERFIRKHYGARGLVVHRLATVFGACLRIGLFGAAAFLRPGSRCRYRLLVAQWKRILNWNLGKRGPGLQEA
ncbi:hypothetical protein B1R32_10941 [Abditibacterium utsteinense]|uniref:Glycosyltransferase 2-like domain-containing protein n=1 Tax=Abditibacterium utsteinense TaxID=1960156 RepID=A0A2S8SSA9_9BACT|nr:glycosyltransferase family 2 protein [Abditibacterium utsteinense]PQV63702.1 hypothetical protein B1R32_10941 [Abditibacterium utsteinense]